MYTVQEVVHRQLNECRIHTCRGVEIQCQWHQLFGAKSEFGTTGLVIGNSLLSNSLKIIT